MFRKTLALVCFALTAACLQTENSSSGDGFTPTGGSEMFEAANQVIANRCNTCHHIGWASLGEDWFVNEGYIIPGDPLNSELYYRIQGSLGPLGPKTMPTVGSITSAERDIIYNWILQIVP